MAVTVSGKSYTQLSSCDSTTAGGTWTGMAGADTGLYREGSASLYGTLRTVGNNDVTFAPSTSKDLSNKHLRLWLMYTGLKQLNTDASGGIQLGCSDGANTGFWYVSGSTSYPGGWYNLVVDTARSVDSGTKPSNMAAITSIILRINLTAAPKNATNTWIDNLCVCDGLTAYGDLSGSPFTIADILSAENATTGGWGVIRQLSGVYFLTGSLDYGDTSGTTTTNYKDTSQVMVFENRKVNASLYGITVSGNATNKTSYQLGEKSGDSGTTGVTIRTESSSQTSKPTFTGTSSNISTLKLYGSTFSDFGVITLPDLNASKECLNCNFEAAGELVPGTGTMTNCNFVSSDGDAITIASTSHAVTYSNFVSCPVGVDITTAGTYTFSAMKFSANTIDIKNSITTTNAASYSETNGDTDVNLNSVTGISAVGQSISGNGAQMASCRFYLKKSGTPAGNMYAKLYASNGSSPYKPTGAALATSDAVSANSLTTSYALTTFTFTDTSGTNVVTLSSGTDNYVIVLEYTAGTGSDYVIARYDGSTPGGSGNYSSYASSTWTGDTGKDLCFYVYTGGIVKINCSSGSNPSASKVSNPNYGSTTISNSVDVIVKIVNKNNVAIQDVQVAVYKSSDNTQIMNEDTLSTGIAQESITYPGADVDVYIRARKSSTGATRYRSISTVGTIKSTGLNVTLTMEVDPVI